MLLRDKKISAWQTGIILFIVMFTNKVLVLPALLAQKGKIEAVYVVAFMFVFDFLLLIAFWRFKTKFGNKNFFDLLKINFGKWFSISVAIFFCVYFFSKSILVFNTFQMFLKGVLYKNGVTFMFLICVLPVVNFLGYAGIRTIGRTAQALFPIIILICVFCVVVGALNVQNEIIFFQSSFADFFQNVFGHIAAFGDIIFLFVIMDKIEVKKGQWKIVFSLTGVGMLVVCSICLVYILSYTYTTFLHPFAIFELLSYIKEYEGLGRIDIITVVLMMLLFYIELSIYFKTFLVSVENVFGNIDRKIYVVFFDLLFVVVVLFFLTNLSSTLWYGEKILPYFQIFPYFVFPIVLLGVRKGVANE